MIVSLYVYYVVLLASFVIGFYCTRGLNSTSRHIKLLPWFLLYVFITEMIGLVCNIKFGNNHWVYNIYVVAQFCFYSYMLYQMIENSRIRKMLTCIVISYLLFAPFNFFLIQKINQFNTFNFIAAGISLSLFSGYSLNELFKKDIAGSPFKTPFFWIASSILVLNSCMVPLILPVTIGLHFSTREWRIVTFLISLVNFIVYPMFIVAFLFLYKNNKHSSI